MLNTMILAHGNNIVNKKNIFVARGIPPVVT